ncbi:MAG: S8 family peptidase, partial [Pseudomonas sp.]
VVVAASGNDGCDCMVYPARYPEVVSVGALATNNQRASFTSYGTSLDILAPGTSITSASWTASNQTTAYSSNLQGTSMATPLVSGLLTRLLSQRPTATPLQLIAGLTENTNRLTLAATVPRTTLLGYGSVDATKATGRFATAQSLPYAYSFTPVSKGATLAPNSPAEVFSGYLVQNCSAEQPGSTPLYELTRAGSTFFTVSQVEVWQAEAAGYQPRLFAEVCLQQPHDTPGAIRSLDLFREFRNVYEMLLP